MPFGSTTLLWLLMGATAPALDQVGYAAPIAQATLFIDGRTHTVQILNETNVSLRLVPAEYQDLDIAKSIDIDCDLPANQRQLMVSARIDTRYHMIPLDIIEYKEYNPSYIKLGIDTIYINNSSDHEDFNDHKVYIDFYARDLGVR